MVAFQYNFDKLLKFIGFFENQGANMLKILDHAFAVLMLLTPCYSMAKQMNKTDIHIIEFKNLPTIGNFQNTEIRLGGLSSLELTSFKNDTYSFTSVTDRGPNGPVIEFDSKLGQNLRPFLIPDFSPLIVHFELNKQNKIQNLTTENLYFNSTEKISGLPTTKQIATNVDQVEQAIFNGQKISTDVKGFDVEGHCSDNLGRTWISEEYLPSIAVFDKNKKMIQRLVPGTDFPSEYADRKINRGFEGLACDSKYIYAMLQSPLPFKNISNDKSVRILRIDLKTLKAKDQLIYQLDSKKTDKIGDITFDALGNLYVLEQNGKLGSKSKRFLFKIEIVDKNIIALDENPEMWTESEFKNKTLAKVLVKDLSDELSNIEKIEGITVFNDTVFMISDNDFGIAETNDGQFKIDPDQTPQFIWFKLKDKK